MSNSKSLDQYDQTLISILENEKSILGFLSTIFSFLARRTDFYYVPKSPHENMGFPPGVAEELVVKVLRKCDPKTWKLNDDLKSQDANNEIMCSTVAQEVEIVDDSCNSPASSDIEQDSSQNENKMSTSQNDTPSNSQNANTNPNNLPVNYEAPVIPVQNSESYNGAVRDKYTWSQTIMDLDVVVKLPLDVKSAKDLKVTLQPGEICVAHRNGEVIIKDSFIFKIKTIDSFWSISEGRLLIHLEKVQERWWERLLSEEVAIDLDKIDCSRPLDELPEDHVAKVRELQWNQEQKRKGLPTSDELRNIEILKKAWNSPGSPFQGKEFDPNVLYK